MPLLDEALLHDFPWTLRANLGNLTPVKAIHFVGQVLTSKLAVAWAV